MIPPPHRLTLAADTFVGLVAGLVTLLLWAVALRTVLRVGLRMWRERHAK